VNQAGFAWRKFFRIYSFSENNEIIYLKNYIILTNPISEDLIPVLRKHL